MRHPQKGDSFDSFLKAKVMKAVALKLVLRSWWRNKTFSIISIVSLAIGIACTNLLVAFVIYEFNIEADNPCLLYTSDAADEL